MGNLCHGFTFMRLKIFFLFSYNTLDNQEPLAQILSYFILCCGSQNHSFYGLLSLKMNQCLT